MTQKRLILTGVLISVFLASIVSFYASSSPDGLERVGEDIGFIQNAQDSAVAGSPLADYAFAGIESVRLSSGLAGFIGVVATMGVAFGLFGLVSKKSK